MLSSTCFLFIQSFDLCFCFHLFSPKKWKNKVTCILGKKEKPLQFRVKPHKYGLHKRWTEYSFWMFQFCKEISFRFSSWQCICNSWSWFVVNCTDLLHRNRFKNTFYEQSKVRIKLYLANDMVAETYREEARKIPKFHLSKK